MLGVHWGLVRKDLFFGGSNGSQGFVGCFLGYIVGWKFNWV